MPLETIAPARLSEARYDLRNVLDDCRMKYTAGTHAIYLYPGKELSAALPQPVDKFPPGTGFKVLKRRRGKRVERYHHTKYLIVESVMSGTLADNLAVAVLNTRLPHLREWVEWRGSLADVYNQRLSKIPQITVPLYETRSDRHYDSYQNFVIQTPDRDQLKAHLGEWGIETLVSWPVPNHLQTGLGLSHFELPVTEQISASVISLPMYAELTVEEVEYVCDCVAQFALYS